MFPYPSSLDTLIAFGVVFLLGLLWTRIHRSACFCRATSTTMEPAA